MPDISKITLPNDSNTYNIKDAVARDTVKGYSSFAATQKIYVGNTAPNLVSTSGWSTGTLYIYVKP